MPLTQKGDDLDIDQNPYVRLPPFPSGTHLDGNWTYTWASSGMTATSSGGVAVERTLVLGKDGRFRRTGWAGGSSTTDLGGVSVSGKKKGSGGTYEIAGYELKLQPDNGQPETLSIFASDRGSDKVLVIDRDNYLKDE